MQHIRRRPVKVQHDRSPFQYTILRVVPRIERGECINVGVVLFCPERLTTERHERRCAWERRDPAASTADWRCVRVEVIDDGRGFEREIRERSLDELGAWGLSIVDAEASRWGVHEGTTHVWFELELPGPRLGPA